MDKTRINEDGTKEIAVSGVMWMREQDAQARTKRVAIPVDEELPAFKD